MNITTAELEERYRELSDLEIIELHQSGELTDIAMFTIEKVIAERHLTDKSAISLRLLVKSSGFD